MAGVPAAAAAGDAAAGRQAFAKCSACHQVGSSARGAFGPHLNGLLGRRAGSTAYPYSAAMKASGLTWDDATLRAFLRSPGDTVPGTKMRFWGLGSERQIDDLLAYLRTFQDLHDTAR